MPENHRILVVEDEPSINMDICMNLESHGYLIAGSTHMAENAIEILKKKTVDLVMLDITLAGEMTGIDLGEKLDQEFGIPFIYLTSYSDEATIEKAAHTFPSSYIVKPFKDKDLVPAIRVALARKALKRQEQIPSLEIINKSQINQISSTEYKVLQGIWKGFSNKQIAETNYVSYNTIKTHIRNIYTKTNLRSKPEIINYLRGLK